MVRITTNFLNFQKISDEKLSDEVLKLGDGFYFGCIRYAEFINNAIAKNQSITNVPKRDIQAEDVIFWLYTR